MCGICGVVSSSRSPDPKLVIRMMGRLAHRGPDGSGYFRDRYAVLGHTRLSIIDTAGGAQPLSNEDGSLWIAFNGEIFNYVELAHELRSRGHILRTASDTEVIVHSWEEWGEGCFRRFNGQWALALWDRNERRLVLSRDRMGIRPLYYTIDGDRILFASEVKAIYADPSVYRAFDLVGLRQTFTFWSTVAPRTVYERIEQLEPGHVAIYEHGRLGKRSYWTMAFPSAGEDNGRSAAENRETLRERLIEASRLRFLRSDVPVAAYLSGGIDSSITAAIISRYTNTPIRTFSLRFSDAEFDEGRFQAEMVERLGTDHSSVEVSASDISGAFPEAVLHGESPILRAASVPLLLLSRLVRRSGYKVVVTGEGADEVLGGYDLFREMRVRMFMARNPASTTRHQAIRLLYPWMQRSPTATPEMARVFFGRNLDINDVAISHRPRWDSTSAVIGLMSPEVGAQTAAIPVVDELLAGMPDESSGWEPLARAQWLEMTTLLPGYLLSSQGDRMLMANSVEGRFPFLDVELVEFVNSLPAAHKLFGLDEKHILKEAFADLVPASIRQRAKQPYRAPDAGSFFANARCEWVEELTSKQAVEDAGIFQPGAVTGLVAKCARNGGRRMSNTDNMRLLAVLSTMLVHRDFICGLAFQQEERPPQPMRMIDTVEKREGVLCE